MASSPQHEPTMEEILASIRKIISEDSTEAAPAAEAPAAAAATPAPAPAPVAAAPKVEEDEDVLDLTEEVKEEPAPVAAAPAPEPVHDDVVFQSIEEPKPAAMTGDDIFSDKTRKAMDDAFSKLDHEEDARDTAPAPMASTFKSTSVNGDSVEAVFELAVRDAVGPHIDQWMSGQKDDLLAAMRPLIREWMDEHFPSILEGAVRDEVSRAVKARGKR